METDVSKPSCPESSRKYVYQTPSPSSKFKTLSRVGSRDRFTSITSISHEKSVINSKRNSSLKKSLPRPLASRDTTDDGNDLVRSHGRRNRESQSPSESRGPGSLASSARKELKASESFKQLQLLSMSPSNEKRGEVLKEVDNLFSSPTRDASPIASQEGDVVAEPVENNTLAAKEKVEIFFTELYEALSIHDAIPDSITLSIPDIQSSLAFLKWEMKGPCIILDLMDDVLTSLNSANLTSDLKKSVELTLALIEARPMEENSSRFLYTYLDNKLRSIEEHMRITISNMPLKSLNEMKKLACPPSEIQSLSYALLTLFTEINSNLDTSVNGSSRVMSSRAWETMGLFLSKPGNVIQTMRKYADCVRGDKISNNIVKKAKEVFLKINTETLKSMDMSAVCGIYDFLIDAFYFYDVWTQIKPIMPVQKRRQTIHSLKINTAIPKESLKSPAKRGVKSPTVKAATSPRKLKSRSRSSCDLGKPVVPKLNLNLAQNAVVTQPQPDSLNSFDKQPSAHQSFAEYVDTLKSSIVFSEILPMPIDSKDSETFEKMFIQPSVLQEVDPEPKPELQSESNPDTERKHQYTLSLNGECNYMFLTADSGKHKERVEVITLPENPFPVNQPLDSERTVEISIEMEMFEELEHGGTPKFSEQNQDKSIEEKFEMISDFYSKISSQQEYVDDEFAMPVQKEENYILSFESSDHKCMVKPIASIIVLKKNEVKCSELVKPIVNPEEIQPKTTMEVAQTTPNQEIQAQFTVCDISCIELDESITKLIPIAETLDEQYKDWPSAGRRDSLRKRKVRDILRNRGVSADYPLKSRNIERRIPPPISFEPVEPAGPVEPPKHEQKHQEEAIPPVLDTSLNVHEMSVDRSTDKSFKNYVKKQHMNMTSRSFLSSRCRSERAFCSVNELFNTSRDSIKPFVAELESEVELEKKSLRSLESVNKKEEWEVQRVIKKQTKEEEKKKMLQEIRYQKQQLIKEQRLKEEKRIKERQEELKKKEEEHQERKRQKLLREQTQQKLIKEEIERNKAKAALAMRSRSPSKPRVRSAGVKVLKDQQSATVLMRKLDIDDNESRLQEKASELMCARRAIMNEKRKLQVLLDKYKKK
jgi:hypothetical protein